MLVTTVPANAPLGITVYLLFRSITFSEPGGLVNPSVFATDKFTLVLQREIVKLPSVSPDSGLCGQYTPSNPSGPSIYMGPAVSVWLSKSNTTVPKDA